MNQQDSQPPSIPPKEPEPTKPEKAKNKQPPRRATRELKASLLNDNKFLWSVGWRIALGLVIIFGMLGIGAVSLFTSAQERIANQIALTELSLSNKVNSTSIQVSNLILTTFESSNIVEIVKGVASERAEHILEVQVAPAVSRLTNDIAVFTDEIDGLKKTKEQQELRIEELNQSINQSQNIESNLLVVINEARFALQRLDQDSEFINTAILADNDDRNAYEQLMKWAADSTYRLTASAQSVAKRIQNSYYRDNAPYSQVTWDQFSNKSNHAWNIHFINMGWKLIQPHETKDYITFVWGHTNLTKEQRISFLRNAYLKDSRNSLQGANSAAELVAKELGASYNPSFTYSSIEQRWLEYTKTNHLFSQSTNESPNTIYDLITTSDTNRILALREWGATKLVLFKLRYPAVPDSIEGKYFGYSTSVSETMKPNIKKHLNTLWTFFDDFDTDDVKIEFKYERDLTRSNVQDINVTTNMLILDYTNRFPIPPP